MVVIFFTSRTRGHADFIGNVSCTGFRMFVCQEKGKKCGSAAITNYSLQPNQTVLMDPMGDGLLHQNLLNCLLKLEQLFVLKLLTQIKPGNEVTEGNSLLWTKSQNQNPKSSSWTLVSFLLWGLGSFWQRALKDQILLNLTSGLFLSNC